MTVYYPNGPNGRWDPIPKQTEGAYEEYKKIKGFEDVGYFLTPYVVSGGAVTPNVQRNDTVDASTIVVSLNNDIMARDSASFKTKTANTTYFLDFTKDGDWAWGVIHPEGTVAEDYLTVAEVTTDENGNVDEITDVRGVVGGFRLKSDYGLFGYFRGIIDVRDKGAKGDGETDDTDAIQSAMDGMVEGDVLIVPYGDFNVSNLTFNPPDNCTVLCYGRLIGTASGVTLTIGSAAEETWRLNVQQLKVARQTRDISSGNIGVEIINCISGHFGITYVYGYEKNIQCRGTNDIGFVHNTLFLHDLIDGKKSLYLTSDDGGWCNENNFYGGNFSFTSAVTDHTDHVHLTINTGNNNRFYSPSFQSGSLDSKACIFEDGFNTLISPRLEVFAEAFWADGIELTADSSYNVIVSGYGVFLTTIDDSGEYNKIFAADGIRYSVSSSGALLQTFNDFSNGAKHQSILDSTGTERYYVTGSGVVWSNQNGYFHNGIRWTTGDLSYTDRGLYTGSGSPEGVITARPGSMYLNNSGGANTTLYVKEAGSGNTGWVAK